MDPSLTVAPNCNLDAEVGQDSGRPPTLVLGHLFLVAAPGKPDSHLSTGTVLVSMLAAWWHGVSMVAPGTEVFEGSYLSLFRLKDKWGVVAFPQHILPSSLQLWRDVIDSLVSHSLWLRALLGLPEKETVYLDVPEEQGQTLSGHVTR